MMCAGLIFFITYSAGSHADETVNGLMATENADGGIEIVYTDPDTEHEGGKVTIGPDVAATVAVSNAEANDAIDCNLPENARAKS